MWFCVNNIFAVLAGKLFIMSSFIWVPYFKQENRSQILAWFFLSCVKTCTEGQRRWGFLGFFCALGRAQFPCFPFNMSENSTFPAKQYLRTIKGDMDLHTLSSLFPETQESGSVGPTQLRFSCTMSLVIYVM